MQLVIAFLQMLNLLHLLTCLLRSACNALFSHSHLSFYICFGCRLRLQLGRLLRQLLQQLALQRLMLNRRSFCTYQFLLNLM